MIDICYVSEAQIQNLNNAVKLTAPDVPSR